MSVPARRIDLVPAPPRRRTPLAPGSTRPATPARTTAARPRASSPSSQRRRARRGLHPTFMVFASAVVIGLVIGVVALNALFAQTALAVHSTQTQVASLNQQQDMLATRAAGLSSPSRIATWAKRYQMVVPDTVVILRVPRLTRSPAGSR